MSENQEHKTWMMLRRADPTRYFDIKECPWFDVVWSNNTTNNVKSVTGYNKYGTWKCTSESTKFYTNCKDAWDPSDASWAIGDFKKTYGNTLELPESLAICPKTIKIKYWTAAVSSRYASYSLYGYNPLTETWTTLATSKVQTAPCIIEYTISGDAFYSKFKVTAFQYASGSNDATCVHWVDITSGTLKVNMDLLPKTSN